MSRKAKAISLSVLLVFSGACGGEDPSDDDAATAAATDLSPSARPEVLETLRQDLAAERHPSDGGGRAWLEQGSLPAVAGEAGTWTLVYEAGPLGIAEDGVLFFQAPAFWGWSTPQVREPAAAGYTEVTTSAQGVELHPDTVGESLLAIVIGGRALEAGERVRIAYGAGPQGARADRYAERDSVFWVGVDGDGDGVRGLVPDPPSVNVASGVARRLVLTLPTTARPGEAVRLTVAAVDRVGNAAAEFEGEIRLSGPEGSLLFPMLVSLGPGDEGRKSVIATAPIEGVFRLDAEVAGGGPVGRSNPIVVGPDAPSVLWGDLHGHSNFSDGTGTPEDYFRYARDVAALDVVALTDHDHWGMQPLSRHPELWEEIVRQTHSFHEPGRFVTILGYEWTSWLHGHRHVLYFDDAGEVLSSVDPDYDDPGKLWAALRGREAMTFAHHSAGGPVATNWEIPPDPAIEPVTEIVSVHGSSEAADSPKGIYAPVPGNYVRDVLARGYRLGFIGSGDSHDGHPGLVAIAGASGGLAAILADELSREGVLAALRARRAYATNGPRIFLDVRLGGFPMGSTIHPDEGPIELSVRVVAEAPIESIDVVRSEGVVPLAIAARESVELRREVRDLEPGDFLYVRVVQADGGAAWSSPFFVR